MTGLEVLILAMFFQVKHVITDFLLQKRYQYSNKHIYGHPGGLLHAGIITAGTTLMFAIFAAQFGHITFGVAALLLLFEFAIHYNIDWAKMNICRGCCWKPDNSEHFWELLGIDQFLHHMTNLLQILVIYLLAK
jgi:hypothetical protein